MPKNKKKLTCLPLPLSLGNKYTPKPAIPTRTNETATEPPAQPLPPSLSLWKQTPPHNRIPYIQKKI